MTSLLFWAAAALAAVFSGILASRFRAAKAPVYGWWTLSFLLYAAAFVTEALTVSSNWHLVWEYQLYIAASAGLVGAMSVGTVQLAWPRSKAATGYAIYFVVAELLLVVLTVLLPPVLEGSWRSLNAGQHGITGPTQMVYLGIAAIGGPIVVFSALWSWWKTRRYSTLLIAVGALVPSSAGALASQGVATALFPVLNILGLVLIFLGYMKSRPRVRTGAPAVVTGNAAREIKQRNVRGSLHG